MPSGSSLAPNDDGGGDRPPSPDPIGARSRTPSPVSSARASSLPLPLRSLFALNGATLQIPSLALLYIVNDRAAVPPAYLPAYGAVSFLPWCAKPAYAFLSAAISGPTGGGGSGLGRPRRLLPRHALLSLLLGLSGLSFVGTSYVPPGGIVQCFAWGFLRGVASSWPEFLLGVALIECARRSAAAAAAAGGGSSTTSRGDEGGNDDANDDGGGYVPRYEDLASVYQSQAATSRNLGSLAASGFAFGLFAWRHYGPRGARTEELSDAVVSALLFAAAALSAAGGAIALRYEVGTFDGESSSSLYDGADEGNGHVAGSNAHGGHDSPSASVGRKRRASLGRVESYHAIPTEEVSNAHHHLEIDVTSSNHWPPGRGEPSPTSGEGGSVTAASEPSQFAMRWQRRCDIVSLGLFQTLLVLSALQRPIVTVSTSAVWAGLTFLTGLCLVVTFVASSYYQRKGEGDEVDHASHTEAIPPRRLALYLILRHSVPIAGFLVYSFIYTVFAADPLFLQILSIVESAVSTLATHFYGRYLAKTYNSGWGIVGLIAVLSIVVSLVSLLDVIVVRVANGGGGGAHLRWLVLFVSVFTYFMGEVAFMPSVVLATTNVVSGNDPAKERRGVSPPDGDRGDAGGVGTSSCRRELTETDIDPPSESRAGAREERGGRQRRRRARPPPPPAYYDEGVQYASFVSCIDFGAQVGDWISVPVIAALGITRENGWANLDRFIVICALARMASVALLWLIRPPPNRRVPPANADSV